MNLKETVKVCIRSRPTSNFPSDSLDINPSSSTIKIHLAKPKGEQINNQQEDWQFKFNHVLHNVNQQVVYDTCAADIVDACLDGINGTILAYGQTGAGKTFTMIGGTDFKLRGVAPRAIGHVFRVINDRPQFTFEVKVSYLEIYTENFYDLLNDNTQPLPDLAVREDEKGSVAIKGLQVPVVGSEEEALALLFRGEQNRAVGDHQMNKNSTRSHCVFTIYIQQRSRIESSAKVIHSKLNIVDLAGSERVGKTASSGQTLEEAKHINKSLSFLEQVVVALANRSREHIPFRQSKLTNVLRDSLGGNCKTRLIANIWCEREQLDETISTMKFATRMMKVQNHASVNVQLDPQALVKQYAREIKQLRQELAMHDTLANREKQVLYEPFTPEQQAEIRETVRRYADNETAAIEIINLRQINECFAQLKAMINDLRDGVAVGGGDSRGLQNNFQPSSQGHRASIQDGQNNGPAFVGDLDPMQGGFNVGSAPYNARPSSPMSSSPNRSPAKMQPRRRSIDQGKDRDTTSTQGNTLAETPSRNMFTTAAEARAAQFGEFKNNEGSEYNQQYLKARNELQVKRKQLKTLTAQVNTLTKQISNCNNEIKQKRLLRQQEDNRPRFGDGPMNQDLEVIDEEEFRLIQTVKKLKKEYTQVFDNRQTLMDQVNRIKMQADEYKLQLASAFMKAMQEDGLDEMTDKVATRGLQPRERKAKTTEELDVGEQFEQLEMQRIMSEHPDSLSFYNARKLTGPLKKRMQGARKPVGNQRPRMRV